jgi:hypothetical protein
MAEAEFVQGDRLPDMTATLHDEGNITAVTDLTAATVRFQMRKLNDRRYTVNQLADVIGDPTLGKVRYQWGPNDLNVPGEYLVQWEVTHSDGKTQTTFRQHTIEVRRQ